MYIPREKLLRKFWVILLSLMVLVHMLILPVSAAVNVNENTSAVNRSTMKTAPIRAKEIEEPIPNPQYQYYLNHKEEFIYGYIPPKYIFPQEKTRIIRTRAASPFANIRKYDSRSSDTNENRFGRNVVTKRKDQFYTGTCWAHAYLAVVESLLKIKYGEDYDLSEGHMAYNVDDQTNLQSGGLDEDALAYCARLSGPVLEENLPAYSINEDDPKDRKQKEFDPSRATSLPEGERDTFKIMGDAFNKKLDFLVTRTLELDLTLENLKRCIYENGSVQGTYLIAEDGYSKDVLGGRWIDKWSVKKNGVRYHYVRNFKNSNYLKYNHAVALIGWDDDKEIKNKLGETAKGAFLVKNSVPAPPYDRYDDARGYHWISYESFLGNGDIVPSFTKIITPREVRTMEPDERVSLKNVYNTGKTNYVREANIKGNLNKAINIYERSNNEPETIKYLTYYNVSDGPAPYKIFITEDADILKGQKTTFANGTQGETLKDIQSDKWVELASGTFTEKGYNTLNVTRPFTLTNDKFALKIEIESKKIGLAYKSWSEGEKAPAISYRYNDENADPFYEKIQDSYCLFLGAITVKPNEYAVTVSADTNGTATANPSKGPKGTKVTIKAVPNPGYEFDKWEVEGATALDPQASETTLTIGEENVTAKAIFKKIPPKEYTVSFETDYGTKPEDQKIKENGKATAPTGFEKDTTEILDSTSGKTYVFKGWFLGTEEYNFETEVKENKVLKAKWEEKIIPIVEYTVTVSTDTNGTATADVNKGPRGTKVTIKAVPNPGYEFDKWEVKGATAQDPQASETTITIGEGNATAKAIFKIIPAKEYKVSFETDYGTKPEDQKIKENGKATAPQGFEKDKTEILDSTSGKAYVFKGWFLGTEEYNFETEVKENKMLKAKWEEKIIPIVEYTVTVSTDTNGTATADVNKGPRGTKVTIKAVPNPGYEFDKWEVKGATAQDPQASETTITIGEGNATAKAVFKKAKKVFDPAHVETMVVKTQPTKQIYTEGENLALAGLVVTLTDNQGVTEDVAFADFATYAITATPANATSLTVAVNNGKAVELAKGSLNAQTNALTVNAKVFDPTHVEKMVVKIQPTKLNYTEGEKLDLTGLVVTLTDNQGVTEDVAFADFATYAITATPANATSLTVAVNNGKAVELAKGSLNAQTNALTVNATVTPQPPTPGLDPIVGPVDPTDPSGGKPADTSKYWAVTFVSADETKGTVAAENTVYVLKTETKTLADIARFAPVATPYYGYEFSGWSPYLYGNQTIINGNTIIYARFEEPYTPSYPYPHERRRPRRKYYDRNDRYDRDDNEEEKIEEAKVYDKLEAILFINNTLMQKSVNGVVSQVRMDIAPFIYQSRTMLPIRFVAEALGFMVTWDANTRTVYLVDKENIVQIPVDTNNIIVNGNTFVSDVKPMIKNNRTMLPIANVARALGLQDGKDILWDAVRAMVTIKRNVLK